MRQFQPLLTEKQLIFARFYASDPEGHVTKAALAAGCSQASAHVMGSRWLRNVKIQAEVNRLRAEKLTKFDISAEKVLSEIAKLAFLDIRRAFNPDGSLKQISELDAETAAAVAGIEHEKLFDHFGRGQANHVGTTTKIKLASKLQALEMLGRWHKLRLWEENINVTGLEGLAERLADIRKRKNSTAS